VLKDGDVKPVSYVWFPKAENIPEYCGVIQLEKAEKPVNLIQCGDFDGPHKKWGIGAWGVARRFVPENEVFVTRGTSLRLEGNTYYATQKIPVQPGHRYKVSFYIRTENLKPGVRAMVTFGGPPANNVHVFDHNQIYLSGTHPWRRIVKTFQAPDVFGTKRVPQLSFGLGKKSTGKCWIDHVELIEVK